MHERIFEMKIGDRVIAEDNHEGKIIKGKTGSIIGTASSTGMPLIEFDHNIDGHDGRGTNIQHIAGKDKHCWYVPEEKMKLVTVPQPFTLIIRPDAHNPDITTATLKIGKETVRTESVTRYCKDAYDRDTAIKAVVEKMCGKPVNEVKREAVKGEWIKIVDSYASLDVYKNGEIYQVADVSKDYGCTYINAKNPKHCSSSKVGNTPLYLKEYVVLENYRPESDCSETVCNEPVKVESPKRLPKIGEYIKIVKSISSYYKNGEIYKVTSVNDGTGIKARGAYFGDGYFAYESEYEVLDNYTPPAELPKPIMINGMELKKGSKFILKHDYNAEDSCRLGECGWTVLRNRVHQVEYITAERKLVHFKSKVHSDGHEWHVYASAIDRIIED